MKIKLDENLPSELRVILGSGGHDIDAVPDEGLTGQNDELVWRATQAAERFFITQDLDFSDIRRFQPGTHQGLMLVRLREPRRRRLIDRVADVFRRPEASTWTRCFVVVTDHKVRVRRAQR